MTTRLSASYHCVLGWGGNSQVVVNVWCLGVVICLGLVVHVLCPACLIKETMRFLRNMYFYVLPVLSSLSVIGLSGAVHFGQLLFEPDSEISIYTIRGHQSYSLDLCT
jgi:hypothetical protein